MHSISKQMQFNIIVESTSYINIHTYTKKQIHRYIHLNITTMSINVYTLTQQVNHYLQLDTTSYIHQR